MQNREFPTKVFPSIIIDIIEYLYKYSNFPIPYSGAAVLVAVATVMGSRFMLRLSDTWCISPNLYMAIVGKSGTFKSPVINFFFKPIAEFDSTNIAAYNRRMEEYLHGPDRDDLSKKPKAMQMIVRDVTKEAITPILRANPFGITCIRDELASFFKSFNSYRNTGDDEEFFLSCYSQVDIVVNRATKDYIENVPKPTLSIIGGLQTNLVGDFFTKKRVDNGLMSRFQFVFDPDENLPALLNLLEPRNRDVSKMWADMLFKEDVANLTQREYSLSADSMDAYVTWYNKREVEMIARDGENMGEVRKMRGIVCKFALILHYLYGESNNASIPVETMRNATILGDYFLNTSREISIFVKNGGFDRRPAYRLLGQLDETFTTKVALAVAEQMKIPRSTFYNLLNQLIDDGIIIKIQHGEYKKKE